MRKEEDYFEAATGLQGAVGIWGRDLESGKSRTTVKQLTIGQMQSLAGAAGLWPPQFS